MSNAAARPHNPHFRKIKLLLFSESPVGNIQSNNISRPAEITRPPAIYFYATIFRYIAQNSFAVRLQSTTVNAFRDLQIEIIHLSKAIDFLPIFLFSHIVILLNFFIFYKLLDLSHKNSRNINMLLYTYTIWKKHVLY